MITIVSSDARERAAFSALCLARNWNADTCESVRAFRRRINDSMPKVVLTRQKLGDGYSDDVLATLQATSPCEVKVIVLASAGAASSHEARQLALGADCVLRDPVRPDVLLEYLAKYCARPPTAARPARRARTKLLQLANASLDPIERRLQHDGRAIQLTPRETALACALIACRGEILHYDELFEAVLGRRFLGDTSNMRVLLGKLCTSAASIGVPLRPWVQVIPKTGYRYAPPRLRPLASRKPTLSAA